MARPVTVAPARPEKFQVLRPLLADFLENRMCLRTKGEAIPTLECAMEQDEFGALPGVNMSVKCGA